MTKKFILAALALLTGIPTGLNAQYRTPAVGKWNCYLPYNNTKTIAYDGNTFYVAAAASFYTYDAKEQMATPYSKANGMHDVNLVGDAYDRITGSVLLAYQNSNLDIFKDNQFTNIPDIKQSGVSGSKSINQVTAAAGYGFLSTDLGLIMVDLNKAEIKSTIPFYDGSLQATVNACATNGDLIYTATSVGLFKTTLSNNFIQNASSWTKLDNNTFSYIAITGNATYFSRQDSLFKENNGAVTFIRKAANTINHLDVVNEDLWMSVALDNDGSGISYALKLDSANNIKDSIVDEDINGVTDPGDGTLWIGDVSRGLREWDPTAQAWVNHYPAGPSTQSSFAVYADNKDFWIAHGSIDYSNYGYKFNQNFFSAELNNQWNYYLWKCLNLGYGYHFSDVIRITKDPYSGNMYAAAYNGGLVEYNPANDSLRLYREGYLAYDILGDSTSYRVTDAVPDGNGNIWMTQYDVTQPLVVKTADGQWYRYSVGSITRGAELMIDFNGYKWFSIPNSGGGIAVYNDNNTPANPNDDQYKILTMEQAAGTPTSNIVNCLVQDLDGNIWVGTDNGIGVLSCTSDLFSNSNACYASKPVVNFFQNGYLFSDQNVRCIAVDGANRKWVGTATGLWLVSADGNELIYEFTESNSPLLSNNILHIDIDKTIGTVYVSTDQGLCSFGGTATTGVDNMDAKSDLFIYPNPVPSGYTGMISIRGFSTDADVRIADAAGQLVYKTKAAGGQVSWNGADYTGQKVQSGVYLVFATSSDGTGKKTGKFVILK